MKYNIIMTIITIVMIACLVLGCFVMYHILLGELGDITDYSIVFLSGVCFSLLAVLLYLVYCVKQDEVEKRNQS